MQRCVFIRVREIAVRAGLEQQPDDFEIPVLHGARQRCRLQLGEQAVRARAARQQPADPLRIPRQGRAGYGLWYGCA